MLSARSHQAPKLNGRRAEQAIKQPFRISGCRLTPTSALPLGRDASVPHIQLATAKLPSTASVTKFSESLYQWAATLTQSGANYPFVLPLKTDKLEAGFQISLLKQGDLGGFDSAGDLQATVEEVPGQGNVLFVRFFEGPAGLAGRRTPPPSDKNARMEVVLQSLQDIPTLMGTMPSAIRAAVRHATA